jgi:tryptophan-rich sensory protein
MSDRVTWALTFGIAALVFWQPTLTSVETQIAYARRRASLCCSPPPLIFGLVWPILYLLITANLVLFANDEQVSSEHNATYIAVFVIALVNLALNKTWAIYYNIVFPNPKSSLAGLVVYTFLVFATAAALLVVEATVIGDMWWSVVFFLGPYVLWTGYATILIAQFARARYPAPPTEMSGDETVLQGFSLRKRAQ